jgi:phosphoglycolate phosphatase-like HAD superfamily hydrolase
MPGVKELLDTLSECEDVVMGLETGNLEPAAYLKLKRGGIDGYFSFGGFGSDAANRTELVRTAIKRGLATHSEIPDEDIYVIGDSPHDITAGKNLGINTIAVGTGLVAREKILATQPTYFLKDLSDVAAFLRYINCEHL